jgi:hypothetical protein
LGSEPAVAVVELAAMNNDRGNVILKLRQTVQNGIDDLEKIRLAFDGVRNGFVVLAKLLSERCQQMLHSDSLKLHLVSYVLHLTLLLRI